MRMFSARLSPLLRSSLDSLPSPEGMSFRLKLGKKPTLIVTEVYSFRSSQQTVSSCDWNGETQAVAISPRKSAVPTL